MKLTKLGFVFALMAILATPAFGGAIIHFDELGNGDWNGDPMGTIFLSGGGIGYITPDDHFATAGYFLIYDADGTLSDIVQFVAPDQQNSTFVMRFYSLDSNGLPADTLNPPSLQALALLGTATEDANGNFSFINPFSFHGVSNESPTPEPCSLLLLGTGLAALTSKFCRKPLQ